MLTSFFGKSNPINYLILGALLAIGYLFTQFALGDLNLTFKSTFSHLFFIIICVLVLLLLDFIVKKNGLTKSNTYTIFFFSCYSLMFPAIFFEHDIIFANFFLLLALRRLMSLRSDRNTSKKILDASLWITLASLFYFWSLLFFIPLWIAVLQKSNFNYKQMLVPFVGFFTVLVLNTAYQLIVNDSFSWIFEWKQNISFDFTLYNSLAILIPLTLILTLYIWTSFFRFLQIPALPLRERPLFILLMYVSVTTIIIALCAPQKTGAEVLFVLAPFSIINANYIETSRRERQGDTESAEFWFKEFILWVALLLPFIAFL